MKEKNRNQVSLGLSWCLCSWSQNASSERKWHDGRTTVLLVHKLAPVPKRHREAEERSLSRLVSSVTQSCPTLCKPMNCSTPGLPVHQQFPEFTQTHVHWVGMPSNHLILCCPLLLLPSIFPSIRVFSNESVLHIKRPKYWSFSFNISPSNGYSGLISLRMDWLDLLAVQGTLKSLLQHHSSKASILQH